MKKQIIKILSLFTILLISGIPESSAYFTSNVGVNGITMSTGWWVKPSVAVTSPNGGELWTGGSAYDITWTAVSSDPGGTINSIDILLSTNGGATYPITLISGIANTGSYSWTISDPKSITIKVKIVATDNHGLVGSDESDSAFDPADGQILIPTPTPTAEPESSPTPTPTPTATPEDTASPSPSDSPIDLSTPTPTPEETISPTPTPTASPTETSTPSPEETINPSPTPQNE